MTTATPPQAPQPSTAPVALTRMATATPTPMEVGRSTTVPMPSQVNQPNGPIRIMTATATTLLASNPMLASLRRAIQRPIDTVVETMTVTDIPTRTVRGPQPTELIHAQAWPAHRAKTETDVPTKTVTDIPTPTVHGAPPTEPTPSPPTTRSGPTATTTGTVTIHHQLPWAMDAQA